MQSYNTDGYRNLLNKYGTGRDYTEAYRFIADEPFSDIEITENYMAQGLFTKIIDTPADDALRNGHDLHIKDKKTEKYAENTLESLEWKQKATTAIKYARLYGGAIIVMVIDDGRELIDPVDYENAKGIKDLLVYERPFITPDYQSIYQYVPGGTEKFGVPSKYQIANVYGGKSFWVHESRCLVFRNGMVPNMCPYAQYRFFGIPELNRISKELRNTSVAHGNGVRLLDRCVQAIYKMKNLADLMSTETGEDAVIKRLELIDLAKGILNSIVVDADGEDYDYKTATLTGVREIIDSTCTLLSAVTNIPQTKLFGRSPAGMNATGESDLENYYNFVQGIQDTMLQANLKRLLDIAFAIGTNTAALTEKVEYELKFNPVWNQSEKEKADVESVKATTDKVKAETTEIYLNAQVIDAAEIRKQLASADQLEINNIVDENSMGNDSAAVLTDALRNVLEINTDGEDIAHGVGVMVVKDGKILVATRDDGEGICGPGGHMESGERPEDAAIRETMEEFGIVPTNLRFLGGIDAIGGCLPSEEYICTEYIGEPKTDDEEMTSLEWLTIPELLERPLFPAFRASLMLLSKVIKPLDTKIGEEHE